MNAQKNRFALIRILLIVLLIMSPIIGCKTKTWEQAARPDDNFASIFKQPPIGLAKKKNLNYPMDQEALKELPEMTAQDHERLGDSYFSQENFPMACVHYEKSLKLLPGNTQVLYKQGLLFLAGGVYENALIEFQEILKKEPEYALAHEGMGQVFFLKGNLPEAEKHFQEAIKIDPKLWRAHDFLGIIYDFKKNHALAVQEYNAAITLNPTYGPLYNNLGTSYLMVGDFERAIDSFNKALQMKFAQKRLYNNLGLALCRAGRYSEALKAFREGGDEAQAYNNLGCFYLWDGKSEEATIAFEKAIGVRPSFYNKANENLRRSQMEKQNKPLPDFLKQSDPS
jgi:tetratricopeptide (TPR) repeat protein